MSINYLANVPKLKGRENYNDWCFAAENVLVLEGMADAIKQPLPATATAVQIADDLKAKAKLILTIDASLYVHIKQATSTYSLWKILKNMFDDSGYARKISLLRNLISIRLDNCESMTSYVSQIIDTAQKLNGTGFEINDQWIGSLMLAGLPEKYGPMIMAIEHSGITISADAIKTKLLDMSADFEVKSEGAFAARNFHRRNVGSTAKTQVHHGNTGMNGTGTNGTTSSVNNCQNNMAQRKKIIRCYKCKQIGHFKNQCPGAEKTTTNAFSAVFLTNEFSQSDWHLDSGASTHIVSNVNLLSNVCKQPKTKEIIVANQTVVPVLCSGDLQLTTCVGDREYTIDVNNVLCVPNLTTNLLSVSRIIASGNKVVFNQHGCLIYNSQNDCVGEALLENGVYRLIVKKLQQPLAAAMKCSSTTWHRRLGHINTNDLNKLKNGAAEGVLFDDKSEDSKSSCIVCCEGKQTRLPFPRSTTKSEHALELVHTDLCGPMENLSLGKAKYYLLFVDDFSRLCTVYFLKSKSETFTYFKQYKELVENQQSKKIKILRSDNGGEFCSTEMTDFLRKCGIIHQKTNIYTPEQNGLCERYNRSIVEKARCLLYDAKFDKCLWAEAVNTAVYIKNRSPAAGLQDNKTPYEIWTGRKPELNHLRIFGSPAMVHIPKEKRRKWDKKAKKMYLVGYSENIKGYRLYDPISRDVIVARDVVVMENTDNSLTTSIVIEDSTQLERSTEAESDQDGENHSDLEEENQNDKTYVPESSVSDSEDSFVDSMPMSPESEDIVSKNSDLNLPEKRVRRKPDFYQYANMCVEMSDEQISLREAMSGSEKDQWEDAMKQELKSFQDCDSWEIVDRPSGGTVVKNKWVFKKKYNIKGEVRYRARLVAKGFTQKKGIDYNETFSPVLKYSTFRLLLALSVEVGLEINHLDVPTAFLNGLLHEAVYMEIPEYLNINNCNNKVLKLKKAIYGLKQSARAWYTQVEDCLLKLNFKRSNFEPCLFIKNEHNVKIYIALFVDDFFVFYNCQNVYEELINELVAKFKIKDLGQIKQCLGMHVNVYKDCITIDQKHFIESILKKYNMTDCSDSNTPMEINLKLSKNVNSNVVQKYPYQQLIGSLMYLSVLTRPDISYSVSFLSQYNNCFDKIHWTHLKRLLKYLKKTMRYGLVYRKTGCDLCGFVDADWASCTLDRRSYTGYCFILSGSVISYEAKKQKTVALSSTEAEYMALSESCKEAIYLRNILNELTVLNESLSLCLYSDNQSSIKLATNPLFNSKRTKHIDTRHHFVRECVSLNKVKIKYVSTSDMPADIFTKSLSANKHYKFLKSIGMSELKIS